MTDTDDAQIKAEIDGIMKGVKTIMQKIDALTPEEEREQIEGHHKIGLGRNQTFIDPG